MNYDVIVIGGGIAGLTASIYIKRGMKDVLLLESSTFGGQIITSPKVSNYPGCEDISGAELGMRIHDQASHMGVEIKQEKVLSVEGIDEDFTITTNDNTYKAKKIVVATGASPKSLGLPEENNYVGRGLSFCATCDGNFFKGRDVAVIGGGNVALDDALYLSNIANKVYLIHRRDEFRGDAQTLDLLKNRDNVEIITNANLTKIEGEPLINNIVINGDRNIPVNGLFMCIGREPNTLDLDLSKDDKGYIVTNEEMETNVRGIYAVGDVRSKEVRQLTTAASDGTIAATNILKKLNK
jgi:thioredoxin reductase (NADPH)